MGNSVSLRVFIRVIGCVFFFVLFFFWGGGGLTAL